MNAPNPIFLDAVKFAVDDKGRHSLPAEYRFRVSTGGLGPFIVTVGNGRCLKVYSDAEWQRVIRYLNPRFLNLDRIEFEGYLRWVMSLTTSVSPDAQGRIRVPQALLEYAGISREVSIVSMLNCLELWNPSDLEAKQAEAGKLYADAHARLTIDTIPNFMPDDPQPVDDDFSGFLPPGM